MDPINQNPPSAPQQPAPAIPEHNGKKVGPIIATLLIVLILIIAALYVFGSRLNQQMPTDSTADTMNTDLSANASQSIQPVTSNSDDLNDIQKDLNRSTNGIDSQNF